ncbi:sigma-54-dependent transcriptional regulator [Limisalsivibrio acetivorans]|uniref:sigma-54-dependent transcriptional regulator n=1 Tax=Limisalsivibrio acetivorans TaxID=1304888 RepID=UPI0003B3B0CC|nr:sigma-54 dependent transcriptional regulator [Limisalsivibrio acetivorans]
MRNILVIDDDTSLTYSLKKAFNRDYSLSIANNASEAFTILRNNSHIGLIFLDFKLGEENGIDVLERLNKDYPAIPVIFMTAYGNSNTVVEAVKTGAVEYLVKPIEPEVFIESINDYYLENGTSCGDDFIRVPEYDRSIEIAGTSKPMRDVLKLTASASQSDAPVLITGESGTGKDLIAGMLHRHSKRAPEPFIPVNCAAIPSELLESELFGYTKGAFSGASSHKVGLFESANRGTIFLDEISELPYELQAKLLRVLQNGSIQKIGESMACSVDVRIIAASNRNLTQLVDSGDFREDLFYRLSVIGIDIPPLRARKNDIPEIVLYLLGKYNQKNSRKIRCISKELIEILKNQEWRGNVRELENRIREAVALANSEKLCLDNISFGAISSEPHGQLRLYDYFTNKYKNDIYNSSLAECEKVLVQGALSRFNGKLSEAAEWLNISRVTLNAKIKKYDLM